MKLMKEESYFENHVYLCFIINFFSEKTVPVIKTKDILEIIVSFL